MQLLKIIERGRHAKGLYRCRCGAEKVCMTSNVRPHKTVSCGCVRRNQMAGVGRANIEHGFTGTPEHAAYIQAKSRCSDARRPDFANYGGRGIKFLFASFDEFLGSVGRRPPGGYSLDRTNNDGNYEPGNVRWATAKQQRGNQRAKSICRLGNFLRQKGGI